MNVGEVRIAEDKDFEILKNYLTNNDDEWNIQYEKIDTKVWAKATPQEQNINFKLIKVLLHTYCYTHIIVTYYFPPIFAPYNPLC